MFEDIQPGVRGLAYGRHEYPTIHVVTEYLECRFGHVRSEPAAVQDLARDCPIASHKSILEDCQAGIGIIEPKFRW